MECGVQVHAISGQKLLTTQQCVGRCAHKSPITKWANALNESSKNFTEAEHNLLQQYQLLHSPSWEGHVLQKIIPVFWGLPVIGDSRVGKF